MKYVIFEDNSWENFLPFTYTRIIGDMRVGVLKLRQRIGLYFDFEPKNVVIRENLVSLYKIRHKDWQINSFPKGEYCFINSRLRINEDLKAQIDELKFGEKLAFGNAVLAFKVVFEGDMCVCTENLDSFIPCNDSENSLKGGELWSYAWELIHANGDMIREDYEIVFYEEDNFIEIDPGIVGINPYDIWIGEGAILKHGVILDATNGPVIIDENATIMHNAVIVGPAYVGKNSQIKIGAKVYPNTSIGAYCKVGGEVEDTIFQAYSNKQHDGFLGHSYIGEWVNIGADTNNSDLKNTYKPVKVWFYPDKSKRSTDSMFVGCFIGDHSKIGINCSINTGAMIGFGANLYGRDLISDFIPSFSWGEAHNLLSYQFEKFIETVSTVKTRRNEELIDEEIELMKKIYEYKEME